MSICPVCKQSFKQRLRGMPFRQIKLNRREHRPINSIPCPNCGAFILSSPIAKNLMMLGFFICHALASVGFATIVFATPFLLRHFTLVCQIFACGWVIGFYFIAQAAFLTPIFVPVPNEPAPFLNGPFRWFLIGMFLSILLLEVSIFFGQ